MLQEIHVSCTSCCRLQILWSCRIVGLRLGSLSSRSRFAGAAYPAYPVYAPQHPPRGHVALTAAGGREGAQEFVRGFWAFQAIDSPIWMVLTVQNCFYMVLLKIGYSTPKPGQPIFEWSS